MNNEDVVSLCLILLSIAVSLPSFLKISSQTRIFLLLLYIIFLSSFTFYHGSKTLGRDNIIVFVGISVVITFVAEFLGTHYGLIFGHYYYTENLGLKVLDVPIEIPLTWFNILYLSYILSQILLLPFFNFQRSSKIVIKILASSVLVGLFMVTWDFINDPYMVSLGMWVWIQPAEFFNLMLFDIPVSNFIGWFFTSALVIVLFEIYYFKTIHPEVTPLKHSIEINSYVVLIPYMYLVVFQALNGLSTGLFSPITGWRPIALSWTGVSIITILIIVNYTKNKKKINFN